jgi:hypothetical protein
LKTKILWIGVSIMEDFITIQPLPILTHSASTMGLV